MLLSRRSIATALFVVLAGLVWAGCDSSPQGDDFDVQTLTIDGPSQALLSNYDSTAVVPSDENPGISMDVDSARYVNRDYEMGREFNWSVTGEPGATAVGVREGGASFVVDPPDAPGTYSVTASTDVSGDSVTGTFATKVDYPPATEQLAKRGQEAVPALLQIAGLADPLNSDANTGSDAVGGYTALLPTDDAVRDLFDVDQNGVLTRRELPAPVLLSKILQHHVFPDSLLRSDISDGRASTLLPGQVVFLETGLSEFIVNADESEAQTIETDIATSDGVIHRIDDVLLPSGALAFSGQDAQRISSGDTLRVEDAYMPDGGFVVFYDTQALENASTDQERANSIAGTSFYRNPGFTGSVSTVSDGQLDAPEGGTISLTAVIYRDSDGDQTYDDPTALFPDSPYQRNGDREPIEEEATVEVVPFGS